MKPLRRANELSADKERAHRRAVRLEWWTIAFFVSAIAVLYMTLGSSQAMKAAWVEDLLGLVPPVAFLIAARIRYRAPSETYPYGLHRVVTVAFLVASVALLVMGIWILWDSVSKLVRFEHPPIGLVQPWGEPIWRGWFMIAALAYTAVPPVILGRIKMKLAEELHDKVLFADAEMNKADWRTAVAAIVGVVGIGFGLWWADAVAAILISGGIVKDGLKSTAGAVVDLMDIRPRLVDGSAADPLPRRLETELRRMPWVRDARVRLREEGHVFYGEAIVVPRDERGLVDRIHEAWEQLASLDWRLHDLVIMPVASLEQDPQQEADERAAG